MSIFSKPLPNADYITYALLKQLKINISRETRQSCLYDHPEFPSLLAISECLAEWKIPNQAYRISKEEYDKDDLQFPFIAHLGIDNGIFILVHQIENAKVVFSNEMHEKTVMDENEFLQKWTGVALYATVTENSEDKDYKVNSIKKIIRTAKIPLLSVLIVLSIILCIPVQLLNVSFSAIISLKVLGTATSILLLIQTADSNNPLIQNLCSLVKKSDCNAILKSEAAKVTSWLSWSEVGFFYFTGTLILMLIFPSGTNLIKWLNYLAMPYTAYSIYYQYKNRNWCIMCCFVQIILFGEFLVGALSGVNEFIMQPTFLDTLLHVSLAFLFPIVIWSILKPIVSGYAIIKPLKQQLKKFKYNSELFKQALHSQPMLTFADDLIPITLGNPNAETTITMVSNPFCGPCGKAHELLYEWLGYRDDIQLKVLFTTSNHLGEDKDSVPKHANALGRLNNPEMMENALNDWYNQTHKKFNTWSESYPVEYQADDDSLLERQKELCEIAGIAYTPTFFINGYRLPEPYRIHDVKYLLTE